jgi:hypothetical protein
MDAPKIGRFPDNFRLTSRNQPPPSVSEDFPKTGLIDMSLHISMVENSNLRFDGSD